MKIKPNKNKDILDRSRIKRLTYTAVFTSLIIVGGYIAVPIPVSPSPLVLGDMFVLMAGLYMGVKWGVTSVTIWVLLGAIGFPVFPAFTGGIGVLLSPRGGFYIGFLLAAALCGFATKGHQVKIEKVLLTVIVAYVVIFACAVIWMRFWMPSWMAAISAGFLPFIPGTILKIILILFLQRKLRPHLQLDF